LHALLLTHLQQAARANDEETLQALDPHLVIDWVRASLDSKSLRRTPNSLKACSRLFARVVQESHYELQARVPTVNYETLRRARVRLDVLGMMITRRWVEHIFESVPMHKVGFYVFIDASPQWRGLELLATSVDISEAGVLARHFLPALSLPKEFNDALGKGVALLWQAFLCFGFSFAALRRFAESVRSITSDMGVERKLAASLDILPDAYQAFDTKFDINGVQHHQRLYPFALQIAGWRHYFDLLVRRGLGSLRWFPSWLERLKAVTSFLRTETIRSLLCRLLRRKGLGALAAVIEKCQLPGFAAWR
jgi:hypothetical protein